ncbi:MAG: hypothetical protein AABX03_00105, partial [Nanoarchaeota archaeon]
MIKATKDHYVIKKSLLLVFGVLLCSGLVFAITWSGDTGTTFNTGAGVLCVANSSGSFWTQGSNVVNSSNSCYLSSGINSQGNSQTTCCSSGYSCNITSNTCMKVNNVNSCDDYKTPAACANYDLNAVKDSIEDSSGLNVGNFCDQEYVNTNTCKYYGGCGCKWKNNGCVDNYVSDNPCDSSGGNQRTCEITKNEVINKCNDPENVYILSWERKLLYNNGSTAPSQSWCSSGSKEFPCPQKKSLPFFGFFNLMLSASMILVIYLFFI